MSTLAVKKVKLGDHATLSNNFVIEVPAVANGTLSIKREDGTAVLSIAADGKAVIPGVVGTVAQVGGVVTGQVVERGSNANGDYVRFADGTMICTHRADHGATAVSAAGNVFAKSTLSWTFPANFIAAARVSVTGSSQTNQYTWGSASTPSGVSTTYAILCHTAGSPYLAADLIAIGRWF